MCKRKIEKEIHTVWCSLRWGELYKSGTAWGWMGKRAFSGTAAKGRFNATTTLSLLHLCNETKCIHIPISRYYPSDASPWLNEQHYCIYIYIYIWSICMTLTGASGKVVGGDKREVRIFCEKENIQNVIIHGYTSLDILPNSNANQKSWNLSVFLFF